MQAPVSMSHTLMVLSADPEIMRFPQGETQTEKTVPVCPFRVRVQAPVSMSHTLIVSSEEPEIMRFPQGETLTDRTSP